MNELQDPHSDGGLPHSGYVGVRSHGGLVFEDNPIKLRNIELVGSGARRYIEGETLAGEDRASDFEYNRLDGGLN